MDFAVVDLMDESKCYDAVLGWLHPGGFSCPRCGKTDRMIIHRRNRDPVIDYRCGHCGRVFNAFTQTTLAGTHYRPSEIVLILRGIAQGQTTASLARELGVSRGHLLALRHRLQESARATPDRPGTLSDAVVEADEMYQNAGEKRRSAHRQRRPAAAAGQLDQGARHVGKRPPAGGWDRRTRHPRLAAEGHPSQLAGGHSAGGGRPHAGRVHGQHR